MAWFPWPKLCTGYPLKKILIPLLPVMLVACGGDSGDSGNMAADRPQPQAESQEPSPGVTEAVTTADAMMAIAVAENLPTDQAVSAPSKNVVTTDYEDSLYGMGGYYGATPRGFLQRQLDPASEGGLLNRFNETVSENFCLLSQLLPATGDVVDLAPEGAMLTLDAMALTGAQAERIHAACPRLKDDTLQRLADQAPVNLYYRVEDLTAAPDSQYQTKISIGWNQSTYSDFTYFTADAGQFRLLAVQTNVLRPGKGSQYAALVSDSGTGVIRFEAHSLHFGSQADRHDVYRVYANTQTRESLILARSNSDRVHSDRIVALAESVAGGQLAVSFDINAAADISDLRACVYRDDLRLVPAGAVASGCEPDSVIPASGFTAQNLFTIRLKSDLARINETASLQFDSPAGLLNSQPIH